jgi:hypothetical protein
VLRFLGPRAKYGRDSRSGEANGWRSERWEGDEERGRKKFWVGALRLAFWAAYSIVEAEASVEEIWKDGSEAKVAGALL